MPNSDFKSEDKHPNSFRVVVAHPAQQHSYQLAKALMKNHWLFSYVTTIYYKKERLLYRFLTVLLDEKNIRRMRGRSAPAIEMKLKQFNEILGLMFLFLGRILRNKMLLGFAGWALSRRFGRKVARFVEANEVNVLICFDTYALSAFKLLGHTQTIRILDMSSIPVSRICSFIDMELSNGNSFLNSYKMTRSIYSDRIISDSKEELLTADYFLVASTFTKNQLVLSSVDADRIFIVPYGVDLTRYHPPIPVVKKFDEPITFLFVGRMTAVKGFHILLDALSRLKPGTFKCLLVGHAQNSEDLIAKSGCEIEYLGSVPNNEMPGIYRRADVLISSSLYDGFGLTVLEAMASGLCVICSRNTGASDLVSDGETGFLMDANSADQLYVHLYNALQDRKRVEQMCQNARIVAENYSWDAYNHSIASVIQEVCPECE